MHKELCLYLSKCKKKKKKKLYSTILWLHQIFIFSVSDFLKLRNIINEIIMMSQGLYDCMEDNSVLTFINIDNEKQTKHHG